MIRLPKLILLFLLCAALAVGGALAGCSGANSTSVITGSTALPFISGTVYISDPSKNQVVILAPSPGPNSVPANPLSGSATQLNGPLSMAFDGNHNFYVANYNPTTQSSSVLAYAVGAQSNQGPTISIGGSSTTLGVVSGIAVDSSLNIYVSNCSNTSPNCNAGTSSIVVFARNANGNTAPAATLAGSATGLAGPRGLALDGSGNLYVANAGNASITVYGGAASGSAGPSAGGNIAPKTIIQGAATGMQSPTDVIVDAQLNLYVCDSTANAIFYYPGTSAGNASPIRTIRGSATTLSAPTGMALAGDGTLYVANAKNILLFAPVSGGIPPAGNPNVAPEATFSTSLGSVSDVELSI